MQSVVETAAHHGNLCAETTLDLVGDRESQQEVRPAGVDVLGDAEPDVRFEPLWLSSQVAAWFGDYPERERWAKAALAAAREADRKDLEALVTHGLVTGYVNRLELAEAAPLLLRAMELADQSGSLFSRANALSVKGWVELVSERFAEAEEDYTVARHVMIKL